MHELLTNDEMAEADRRAVALGVPSLTLMENAGKAVADEAGKMVTPGSKIAVLCGPGNNGGDGFVAARTLNERGFDVRVACLVPVEQLKGDAAEMAKRLALPVSGITNDSFGNGLIIDALFGAGLSRPLAGREAGIVEALNTGERRILSVDVPSGLNGTTGAAEGPVIRATRTITFFRKKPGHVLMPGRALCGDVIVTDIGIPETVLEPSLSLRVALARGEGQGEGRQQPIVPAATPHPAPLPMQEKSMGRGSALDHLSARENYPGLWVSHFPRARLDGHKYSRGHALVVSGPAFKSGAARLAARGALRIGAGLVTVASPPSALPENAAHLTAMMIKPCGDARDLAEILEDKRKNAVLIGPGAGVGEETRELVLAALGSGAAVVLDADALTSFAQMRDENSSSVGFGFTGATLKHTAGPEALFSVIRARAFLLPLGRRSPEGGYEGAVSSNEVVARPLTHDFPLIHDSPLTPRGEGVRVVITPHEGEFARLFPNVAALGSSKLERAREAAKRSGAIVVLKGPDTVIAHPDGQAAINTNAPPYLATAGSGDVLAGFIAGLLAQGMSAFDAACAAVWLHGECANAFGVGLIAEDLPEILPKVLSDLLNSAGA